MKTSVIAFVFVVVQFICTSGYSQERWYAEFRPGVNFPLSEEEINTGFGFEFNLGYNFMPHLGAYGGWGWNQFKSDQDLFMPKRKYDFEETGYTFGFQFIHPFSQESSLSYLFRLGGIYNHIEIEDTGGNILEDSGHGFGWEAGAGLALDLGQGWDVRPQVGYRSLTREIEIEEVSTDFELNYLKVGAGIAKKF